MVADEQTHTLPADREALERFARFAGFPRSRRLRRRAARRICATCSATMRRCSSTSPAAEAERRTLARSRPTPTTARRSTSSPRWAFASRSKCRRWCGAGTPAATRRCAAPFARGQLAEIVPILLHQFARSANPDAAVIAFDRFLAGLHGGGRLFSLLRQNPDLVALIALVLGTAPRLADSLAQFPEVMDAVIDPSFFGALPEEAELAAGLDRSLGQAASYEDFLDRIRIFAQEHMFLIGTRILSGTVSAEQAGEAFARLADVLIRSLHRAIEENFAKLHGRIAGQETAILALGKLGGREMTATSDLDLIVIYDFDPEHPESSGPRPLYGSQYFSRLTQRLISALTAQTNHGAALPGRHAAAALGPLRPAGDPDRRLCELPGDRGLDLGAHGAHARARGLGLARIRRAGRGRDPRRALPAARRRDGRGRRGRDAPRDRDREGRQRPLEPQIRRRRADRHRVHRAISAARSRRARSPTSSTPRPRACSTRRGGSACWRPRTRRCCARRCGSITISRRCCGCACRRRSIRRRPRPGLVGLLARAADVPDFATLDAFIAETQAKVRASFVRILGASP